mmetsp:Transcript_62813/g.198375  ORF Transcript_62813/g.198375 Transcript_62813/m.198375 type:complete len:267 (-) Transcript_62813:137-937(-)
MASGRGGCVGRVLRKSRVEIRGLVVLQRSGKERNDGDDAPNQPNNDARVDDGPVRISQLLHANDDRKDDGGDPPTREHALQGPVEVADAERRRQDLVPERRVGALLGDDPSTADDAGREALLEASVAFHVGEEEQREGQQPPLPRRLDGTQAVQDDGHDLGDAVAKVPADAKGPPRLHEPRPARSVCGGLLCCSRCRLVGASAQGCAAAAAGPATQQLRAGVRPPLRGGSAGRPQRPCQRSKGGEAGQLPTQPQEGCQAEGSKPSA